MCCYEYYSVRTTQHHDIVPSRCPVLNPKSKIIGILWMVPIYAVDSFLSLRFKNVALYVDMLRDCYEGYALYLFLALMVGYLGDGDEYKVQQLGSGPFYYYYCKQDGAGVVGG